LTLTCIQFVLGTVLGADGKEELTEPEVCIFYSSKETKCYSVVVNIFLDCFVPQVAVGKLQL